MRRRLNLVSGIAVAVAAASLALPRAEAAEDAATTEQAAPLITQKVEELTVVGRQRSSATDVVNERIKQSVVADFLGIEQIKRAGDGTVAAALRRVPGLTVVNDQFVYVRGLGERYSSSQLNGASVPSPDLTRDVLPLDIFPTTILDSLEVQKSYSPDAPAAFGGGSIDIRTRGIPSGPVIDVTLGGGLNSESTSRGLTYSGGGDDWFGQDDGTRALPGAIRSAINQYQGDVSPEMLFRGLRRDGNQHTFAEAEALNRQLATSLNRDTDFQRESLDPDLNGELTLGNSYYFGDGEMWKVGGLAVAAYDRDFRNRERVTRTVVNPDLEVSRTHRTIDHVTVTGIANFGIGYGEEHEITTTSMLLRDTEDEAALTLSNTFNFRREDGRQLRDYSIRFEERELQVHQIRGEHKIGEETLSLFSWLPEWLNGASARWYYSDAIADTKLPGELAISAEDQIDPATGALRATFIRSSGSAADYRFSRLSDDVESYGYHLAKAFELTDWAVELGGGWDYSRKGRSFSQVRLGLGSTVLPGSSAALQGTPSQVFTNDKLLDPVNGFELTLGGIGTESYLAGQTLSGSYGKFDVSFDDTWRLAGGVRWESFQQLSVPINPLEFDVNVGQISTQVPLDSLVFQKDDYHPSLALTYSRDDFWAEEFQLRLGWSITAARPDIREISESTFIDPLTEARVRGNSQLVASEIMNWDARAEWFFGGGDNFTTSLFYKSIRDPIETVQRAGSDQNLALGFINADRGKVYGLEIEWLKSLGDFAEWGWTGDWVSGFFVAGNITLSNSEIVIGEQALDLTNPRRAMTQQSDSVFNVQLGWDAPNGRHSSQVSYNVFGERLYFAGRNGGPDAFEQPFQSLDVVYGYYPMEGVKLQIKAKNLLNDDVTIERNGVTTLQQKVGRSVLASLSWEY